MGEEYLSEISDPLQSTVTLPPGVLNTREPVTTGATPGEDVDSDAEELSSGPEERREVAGPPRGDALDVLGAGCGGAEEVSVDVDVDWNTDWAEPIRGAERASAGMTRSAVSAIAEVTANQARAMAATVALSQVNGRSRRCRLTPGA